MVTRIDMRTAALAAMLVSLVGAGLARAGDPAASMPAPGPAQAPFAIAGANQLLLHRSTSDQRQASYEIALLPASVAAPDADPRAWSPVVVAVVRDGSVQAASNGGVMLQLVAADATHPVLLKLTVDFTRLTRPGSYDVTIGWFRNPAPGNGDAGPAPAGPAPVGVTGGAGGTTLAVSAAGSGSANGPTAARVAAPATSVLPSFVIRLVLPAAQLRPHPAIQIDRFLPILGDPEIAPDVFTLDEISKDAPVDLAIERDGELTADDHPAPADIAFGDGSPTGDRKQPPRPIPADGSSHVAIRITGKLPVGTTRGSLLVRAPELTTAVSIPVEIRSHRSTGWIPIVFLIGILIGLGWRYSSQRRKQQLEKQARVRDVLDRIAELERGYPMAWLADLTDLVIKRDELAGASDPAADAVAAAERAFSAAIAARASKRSTLLVRIAEARDATLPSRFLPAGLDATALARGFQAAYDHAVADELSHAIDRAADASQQLCVVVTGAQAWGRELLALLEPVKDSVPGCPKPARGAVKPAIAKAIDSAGKLTAVSSASVIDGDAPLRPRLDALQTARLDAEQVAQILVKALAVVANTVPATGSPLGEPVLQRIRDIADIAVVPGRPERTIAATLAACQKLADELRTTLDALPAERRSAQYVQQLDAGDYSAILAWRPAAVHSLAPGTPTSHHDQQPEPGKLPPLVAQRVRTISPAPDRLAEAPTLLRYLPEVAAPPRSAAAIRREIAWWVRLGWAISAGAAALAVWAIYGGSFVGTRAEVLGLFATGFATDLAAGGKLEELLGKIKLPGGT